MNKQILELEKLVTELEQMAKSLKTTDSDIFNLKLSLIIEEFHIYHNTGISLKEQGQINEALHWYSEAKQLIPEIFALQNQRKYDITGKRKKKKFTAYGNCQAPALAKFLEHFESFTNSYEYIAIEPVHLMTDKDINEFYNIIPELDLLIYQPVLSSYKNNPQFGYKNIISKLKSNCCYISFPSIYFFGYYPELTYITNIPSVFPFNDKRTEFILHDKNIIKYFLENRTVEEIEFLMNKLDYYSLEFLTTNLQESINELRKRESGLNIDIPISNFIEENYDKLKLFHELNHPNYSLLKYVADKILARSEYVNSFETPLVRI